jgi:hypothetical protein
MLRCPHSVIGRALPQSLMNISVFPAIFYYYVWYGLVYGLEVGKHETCWPPEYISDIR